MDNDRFQKLIDMVEAERAERRDLEAKHASGNAIHQARHEDVNRTIADLNTTIGPLLGQIRLLSSSKKNSRNSSVPPSKDENRPPRKTSSLRQSSGKKSGGQKGHYGSTLQMVSVPDEVTEYHPEFCNSCGIAIASFASLERGVRQVVDIPLVRPVYTEYRIFYKQFIGGHVTCISFPYRVSVPVSYGSNVATQIAHLHSRQHLPSLGSKNTFLQSTIVDQPRYSL